MGNFQALAEAVISKIDQNVSCFASLREETRNKSFRNGNLRGNQDNPRHLSSEENKDLPQETTEETARKPITKGLETKTHENSLSSFHASSTLLSLLPLFFQYAHEQGVYLLHDDKLWLSDLCFGLPLKQLKVLLTDYVANWLDAMSAESVQHKKQNVGRFSANTFIRERLTLNKII